MFLPVIDPIMFKVGNNEDWIDSVAFVDNVGAAIDIRGIEFAMMVRHKVEDKEVTLFATTGNGMMRITGTDHNVLAMNVLVAQMMEFVLGDNVLDCVAAADSHARVIMRGVANIVKGVTR
jgi:hypothetical protein